MKPRTGFALTTSPIWRRSTRLALSDAILIAAIIAATAICPAQTAFAADPAPAAAPVSTDTAKSKAILHFALHLTRTDTPPLPPDTLVVDPAAVPATPAPQSGKSKASAPPLPDVPPLSGLLASPVLSSADGDTASISLSAPATLSYNIALSPTLTSANNTVQVMWNLRLSGKWLPGGASSVTLTGASQMALGREETITEIVLTDSEGKRRSAFRLSGTVTRDGAMPPPASAPVPTPSG